jgi:hypothetical protein
MTAFLAAYVAPALLGFMLSVIIIFLCFLEQ